MPGKILRTLLAAFCALAMASGYVAAQGAKSRVTIAVGGAGGLCYLPTMLAQQLGEYEKAGLEVELINFKGGSQALTAGAGGRPAPGSRPFSYFLQLPPHKHT